MLIGGFQKMTLLDYPGKIACIIFTHGCNFRCPYCHNAALVCESCDAVSEQEIFDYLKKRKGILEGVCVSGGEPCLQKDLLGFLRKVKELGYSVKLDTNGSCPQVLRQAIDQGLCDYVAMDIKNAPDKYALSADVDVDVESIRESVALLLEGRVEYEFRTTVTRELHKKEDMKKIGELIAGAKRYFLQTFTDSGNLIGEGMSAYTPDEMRALADEIRDLVPSVSVRGID